MTKELAYPKINIKAMPRKLGRTVVQTALKTSAMGLSYLRPEANYKASSLFSKFSYHRNTDILESKIVIT